MAKGLFGEPGKALSLDDLNVVQDIPTDDNPPTEPIVQTQEPIVEPTTAPVTPPVSQEPTVELNTPPVVPEPTEEPKQQPFNFEEFNRSLNKSYTSFDQVKADLEKPTMEREYQELEAKYKDLSETYDLLTEQLDPAANFVSEDAMRVEAFKRQYPKKDASIAQKVFSTEDLSSIDDLEMVKMGWKFSATKSLGTDADIEAAVKEELNVDPDTALNEMPRTAQIRLAKMADSYRDAFTQLKSSVELPKKVNIEELKSKYKQDKDQKTSLLQEGWSKIADEALKTTNKIKVPVGAPAGGEEQKFFEWDLGEAPKSEVEQLKQDFLMLGMDPSSDEAKGLFDASLELVLFKKHQPIIFQKYADDLLARQKEEFLEKTHNPNPLKDSVRPEDSSSEKMMNDRSSFALDGLGRSFHGHPLFKQT